MATTVAHGLIGIVVYCATREARSLSSGDTKLPLNVGVLLLAALVANIPDMDMVVGLLLQGDHRVFHGGISHTLFFAGAAGFMVWLLAKHSHHRAGLSIALTLILLSHVMVDIFTGPVIGFYPTHGALPFWPVYESRMILPLTLFKGVQHSNILPGALLTAIWEFVLLFPVTAMVVYRSCKSDFHCEFALAAKTRKY